jgi:hypothetical protein
MLRRFIQAIILGLATAGAAHGASVMGPGAATCGKFAAFYRQVPQVAEAVFFAWAQGYMSALNGAYVSSEHGYIEL